MKCTKEDAVVAVVIGGGKIIVEFLGKTIYNK